MMQLKEVVRTHRYREQISDITSGERGFPGGSVCKVYVCNAGDHLQRRIPGMGFCVGKIPLEKEAATPSSFLAWKIPWTEEPCTLKSMRLQVSDMAEQLNHHHQWGEGREQGNRGLRGTKYYV